MNEKKETKWKNEEHTSKPTLEKTEWKKQKN